MATLIFKVSLSDSMLNDLETKANIKTEGPATGIETLTFALEAEVNRVWQEDLTVPPLSGPVYQPWNGKAEVTFLDKLTSKEEMRR